MRVNRHQLWRDDSSSRTRLKYARYLPQSRPGTSASGGQHFSIHGVRASREYSITCNSAVQSSRPQPSRPPGRIETSVNWAASERFRVSGGYSYVRMEEAAGTDATPLQAPGDTLRTRLQVRAFWTLPRNLEWDSSFEWTSPLNGLAAYSRIDSRLGWRPGEKWELSIGGQNLASPNHTEFLDTFYINSTQIPRSVFARLTIHF